MAPEQLSGLPPSGVIMLAALIRRPRGFTSVAGLARACSIARSTAARSVRILRDMGLIVERVEVRALGRARHVRVLYANLEHRDWPVIQRYLARVDVPTPPMAYPDAPLPAHLRHAFWNVDDEVYANLTPAAEGAYIATRALTTGDPELLDYAAATVDADAWATAARVRGLSREQRALALSLATQAAPRRRVVETRRAPDGP